jgi:hypothetical protein
MVRDGDTRALAGYFNAIELNSLQIVVLGMLALVS